jgi:hypothetical protein
LRRCATGFLHGFMKPWLGGPVKVWYRDNIIGKHSDSIYFHWLCAIICTNLTESLWLCSRRTHALCATYVCIWSLLSSKTSLQVHDYTLEKLITGLSKNHSLSNYQ